MSQCTNFPFNQDIEVIVTYIVYVHRIYWNQCGGLAVKVLNTPEYHMGTCYNLSSPISYLGPCLWPEKAVQYGPKP